MTIMYDVMTQEYRSRSCGGTSQQKGVGKILVDFVPLDGEERFFTTGGGYDKVSACLVGVLRKLGMRIPMSLSGAGYRAVTSWLEENGYTIEAMVFDGVEICRFTKEV